MKHISLFAFLLWIVGPVLAADPEAARIAIQDLGRVNGQSLACSQMGISGQARKLMIKHAPKTRSYGELFEEASNAAFLAQGKGQEDCPQSIEFAARLSKLADRLQATLPAVQ